MARLLVGASDQRTYRFVSIPARCWPTAMTLIEHKGKLEGLRSPLSATATIWFIPGWRPRQLCRSHLPLACPKGYEPDAVISKRRAAKGRRLAVTHSVEEAVAGADAIYTDVWTSMGQEKEVQDRLRAFRAYQVNIASGCAGQKGRGGDALFAGASRRGNHRRSSRKPAVRRFRSGGESPACAEGRDGLAA